MVWQTYAMIYICPKLCSMKNDPKDLFFKPVKVIIVFKKITNNLKDNTLLRCDNTNNIL